MVEGSASDSTHIFAELNAGNIDSQVSEEYDSEDDEPPAEFEENNNCLVILLSKEEKQRLRKPWKLSLIIKMFDKNIGYMTLIRRLSKKCMAS